MNKHLKWLIPAVLVIALIVVVVAMNGGKDQPVSGKDPVPFVTVVPTEETVADPQTTEAAVTESQPSAEAVGAETGHTVEGDAMITVNGVEVKREEVDLIASNLIASYAQYGYDTSDEAFVQAMTAYAVEAAVQLELMEQKAVELGLDKFTDEEIKAIETENAANWAEIVDMYAAYYGGMTEESTEEEIAAARVTALSVLEGMGYTEAIMLEDAMSNAKLERVEAHMIEGAAVADEDVKAIFDERVKQDEATYKDDVASYEFMTQYYGQDVYYVPEGYRGITHILLEVDQELLSNYLALSAELEEQEEAAETGAATATDLATATDVPTATDLATATELPATQADVDAAYAAVIASVQPTIDEINRKLAEGVPFAELIAEYGTDPGMEQEPAKSQGYGVHKDSVIWDAAFVQAAFSVDNVGDVAEPVVGTFGVHIVQYTRDVPAGPVEYTADIQLALHETALAEKESDLFAAKMAEWMEAAEVTYSEEAQAALDAVAETAE